MGLLRGQARRCAVKFLAPVSTLHRGHTTILCLSDWFGLVMAEGFWMKVEKLKSLAIQVFLRVRLDYLYISLSLCRAPCIFSTWATGMLNLFEMTS